MTVPDRVNQFISINGPAAYCDGCIREALDVARNQQVQQITAALATTSDFTRSLESCSVCKNELQVIKAVGHRMKKMGG